MATHRLPILGSGTIPDTSGNVWFEPADILMTTITSAALVAIFKDTATRDGLHGKFDVPQNYVDTANLVIAWTTSAVTAGGDVEWDFDYRAVGGDDAESMNQASTQESVNGNDDAPSVTFERQEHTISLTDGNFAAGDTVLFTLFRDGTDGGDGIAASCILLDLFFEYNDA